MEKPFELHRYDDIMDLPRPVSPNRRRMTGVERGAQFSPFAALTGYGAAVEEAGRLTEQQTELTEDARSLLNDKLCLLDAHLAKAPIVEVTYFLPDAKKQGGSYVRMVGTVRSIDRYEGCLWMERGVRIPLEQLRELRSELFECLESD